MAKRSHKGNAGQLPRTTFRELLELVEKPTDRKRPSAKALRTSGTEVLVQAVYGDASITVYKNGWAIYSEGRRATVCNVWHCQKAVEYVFQDGSTQCVQFEEFADRSCVIRLALEGEYRLTRNESTRKRLRVTTSGIRPVPCRSDAIPRPSSPCRRCRAAGWSALPGPYPP